MPNREYVRNGHLVSIDVDEGSGGKWRWSYTINGGGYTELLDRPLKSEEAADREAEHDANAKADCLPPGDAVE